MMVYSISIESPKLGSMDVFLIKSVTALLCYFISTQSTYPLFTAMVFDFNLNKTKRTLVREREWLTLLLICFKYRIYSQALASSLSLKHQPKALASSFGPGPTYFGTPKTKVPQGTQAINSWGPRVCVSYNHFRGLLMVTRLFSTQILFPWSAT